MLQDVSVRLRTGSNTADINRFRSHTRKGVLNIIVNILFHFFIHKIISKKINQNTNSILLQGSREGTIQFYSFTSIIFQI